MNGGQSGSKWRCKISVFSGEGVYEKGKSNYEMRKNDASVASDQKSTGEGIHKTKSKGSYCSPLLFMDRLVIATFSSSYSDFRILTWNNHQPLQ